MNRRQRGWASAHRSSRRTFGFVGRFALPDIGSHLIFKGGTSLSKAFKLIERFSEDIDISIERGSLGFGGDNEPEAGNSNKEKQRRIEALKAACQRKIESDLLPALAKVIQSKTLGIER